MGHAESDRNILGNITGTLSAPEEILDVKALPDLLDAKDVMRLLRVSRSSAYRLMADAGALRYGTAKNHSLRVPAVRLLALLAEWDRSQP